MLKTRTISTLCAAALIASSAHPHEVVYTAHLDGPSEAPPNASPGIGFSRITIDLDLVTMRIEADFSGLIGTVTAAHIHGPTAMPFSGVAGVMTPLPSFPGFPHGVSSGSFDMTFDLTSASAYNPGFIAASGGTIGGALSALLMSLDEGRSYLNIHSTAFPGGEIRGFYAVIPAPSGVAALAIGGLIATRRRRA
ncbi:MAG: CHRD domain-containing protein [Phycisphaeraceae bacterium]|nr:CHRD domain-containing protein [Phycisphaeraceae bacterium]MBX3368177.1 CHRD domain-containing protein [Phycisphaeraceae bacterium]QYK47850.1 MAG: CHRD domain-containing protein [Phycisphaeraceae bacterium]